MASGFPPLALRFDFNRKKGCSTKIQLNEPAITQISTDTTKMVHGDAPTTRYKIGSSQHLQTPSNTLKNAEHLR
jgi:hypothetical protein